MVQKSLIYLNTFISSGFSISNLHLIQIMLIWPIVMFFGWFDRRDFSLNFTDFLQSLLELLRRKFEFAFIKYSKFDVSKISSSICFSSLLESAFYQNLRILDINFSANVILSFTLRWIPSRCRCDSLMLSSKIILCTSLSKIDMWHFSTLAAF